MATAELAVCLPVLVLLLATALSIVTLGAAQVRAEDAAREAARLAARGDSSAAALAGRVAPGVRVSLHTGAEQVVAVAVLDARLPVPFLPRLPVTATAVAAVEPP